MSKCVHCGAELIEQRFGILGHGGTNWWECPNKCKNPFGIDRGID